MTDTMTTVPNITLREPSNHDIENAILDLWHRTGSPNQFGVRIFTDDHEYSFIATPFTRMGNLMSVGLAMIGNPQVFSIEMAAVTSMYGSAQQVRNRLWAFALAAIDEVGMPVDAEDFDLDLDPLIDEFMGGTS